jgi:HEAT repeat protein
MNAEGSVREQFGQLPTTDEIYHLIDSISIGTAHQTRISAMVSLGSSRDPRAVTPLTDCCRDENREIRQYAVDALSQLKSVRSVPALMERAKDKREDSTIRKTAMMALAGIKGHTALEGLVELSLDTNEDPEIRIFAARMLGYNDKK